jgi:hypothetical protein
MDDMLQSFRASMNETGRFALPASTAIHSFQVIGERASGTNFLRSIVKKNLNIQPTNVLGWKHGFPHMTAIPQDCLVLCSVRNPLDWVLSMHKRPWHAHPDLQSLDWSPFIRAPWHSIVDRQDHFADPQAGVQTTGQDLQLDRHPITGELFDNIFKLRTAKLQSLLGMLNRNCTVAYVQMERATENPLDVVAWIAEEYALETSQTKLRLPKRRMGNRYKRSVTARPETPDRINPSDLSFLRAQVDPEIEDLFGYAHSLN